MKPTAVIFILFASFVSLSLAGQGYSAPQPESTPSSGASSGEKAPLIPKDKPEETPAQVPEGSGETENLRQQSPQAESSGDEAESTQEDSPLLEGESREKSSFLTCSSGLVFSLMLLLAIE
ncbi:hypothetical protein MACK_001327 [Theileria orientalis]|uniref:Uncharacterized protein n=1 Tax=Theileria orientalis TaxID=68886 RepID=A0A976MCL9_THEOR|nr:hypothetical protein MACK_001327 [Theileria orientalis]